MKIDRNGVMFVGMNGATANTVITGCVGERGDSPLGSILSAQEFRHIAFPKQSSFVFSGWDINSGSAYDAALKHRIIPRRLFSSEKERLESIIPFRAVAGEYDVSEAREADYCSQITDFGGAIEKIREDIDRFRTKENLDSCVVIYTGPPLKVREHDFSQVHRDDLEALIRENSPYLTSGMVYAIASIKAGCGFIDFTPNVTLEVPGIIELAQESKVPLAGRDGNTGQSLLKTVLAEMFRIRNLQLVGWYSTNILGNNDGLILTREEHKKIKIKDKLGVIEPIVGYKNFEHVVDISYYGPRGDNKESWDSIDFLGWLGLPMCMKINWLGRDSILAAPLITDLIKHLCYSLKHGHSGIQEHLAIYFKHPLGSGVLPFVEAFNLLRSFYI